MSTTVKTPDSSEPPRRTMFHFLLWTGVLAAPLAWAIQFLMIYALVMHVCSTGTLRGFFWATFPLLAVAIGAGLLSRSNLKRCTIELGETCEAARFLSRLGMLTSALFSLLILVHLIPMFILSACIE
jgi:hypothetical protein